ncbi:unnamed protein product [Ilex paraguariensis]|uniref:WRKY domain-containing protein n=1 Tax=Ilex paraguariensis TaxID=185542 RepID=A0ABC8T8Q2_9AQUA
MEKACNWEQETLINELNQGRELANKLKNYLDTMKSTESCEYLLQKIVSSYDKALSMLKLSALVGETFPVTGMLESPHSTAGSPRSEGSDRDCKDQSNKIIFKKRKILPRWSEKVTICSGTGLEGPIDDGHSWRKYGQKDILGANFPRAYYRCTHRHAQGCLATKQVQRSDEDPSLFEITYRGRHTCIQASHLTPKFASLERKSPKQNNAHSQPQQQEEIQRQSQEIKVNFGTGLKVEIEPGELGIRKEIFPSFSFPSTPIEPENLENHFFLEAMKENNFMGTYSPPFISPATSESNYFPLSPQEMNNFGIGHHLQSSESDLTDIISAPTSGTNSPIGNLDFSHDQVDFDPDFPDILAYFS